MSRVILGMGEGFESVGTIGSPVPVIYEDLVVLVQGPLGESMDFIGNGGGREP